MEAALLGAQEIGFTVFSISVSLIAVFIPLLLMGGIIGRLFREFAITLSAAILVSMVVSLTTTPMMSPVCPEKYRNMQAPLRIVFQRVLDADMGEQTGLVLDHPALVLVIFLGTFGLNVFLLAKVRQRFFPQQDTGAMSGGMQGPQDTSFYAMKTAVQESVSIIKDDPAGSKRDGIYGRPGSHQ